MLKLLRKYNKRLLAFFMVALMVVFVGGSALQELLAPNPNRVVANTDLGDITEAQQRQAADVTKLLSAVGMNWEYPSAGAAKPITRTDWILLTREAEKFGTMVTPTSVRGWMQEQGSLEVIRVVSRRLRVKTEQILQAVANLQSIQLMSNAIASSAAPSTAEVRTLGRDVLDKVMVNAVVLPASAFVDADAEFSESEIQEQWTKHKDTEKGNGLNFGYYVPVSLKLQYVKVDRARIAEKIGIANLEKKAKRFYEENRETSADFLKPATDSSEESEAGEDASKTTPYIPWEDAKDIAIAAVRTQHAEEAAERVANWILGYASETLIDAEIKESGYRDIPAAVASVEYFDKVVDQLPRSISYEGAVSVVTTGLTTERDANKLPGIGKSVFRAEGGSWQAFASLAFRTEAAVETIPQDAGVDRSFYTATYQTSPCVLTDVDGDVYVMRVVGSRPAHVADSVDEVRDQVVQDLRLVRAWEDARMHAEGLLDCEEGATLEQTFLNHEELVSLKDTPAGAWSGYATSPLVTRRNRTDLSAGREMPVHAGWTIGSVSRDLIEEWFQLQYNPQKVMVQELKDRATVIVVEWAETQEGREDEFYEMRPQLTSEVAGQRMRSVVSAWLDPENIRARNGLELVR